MNERLEQIEAQIASGVPGGIAVTPSDVHYLLELARKQPDMLAAAWDAGVDAGRRWTEDAKARNPYRTTK